MRIAAIQMNPIVGDIEGNVSKIVKAIDRMRMHEPDIVLFSELSICGYPPEDLLLHHDFVDSVEKALIKVINSSSKLMVVVGLVRRCGTGEKALYNSAAIIQDGKLLGFHDKCLLPTYDVFDERRYFEPGKETKVWNYKGKKVGVLICEDIWQHSGYVDIDTHYNRDPVLEIQRERPDIILNLSASPYHFQKPDIRVKVCHKAVSTLKCPLVLCCQVGANDELVFDGYTICMDGSGNLRQIGKGFEEDNIVVDFDAPGKIVPFQYDEIQDLYRALVLGVHDYFYKQGFKKGCIGLSGGIDSSLVACIAVDALGKDNVLGVSMPSRYTADQSHRDAETLTRNLGIELKKIPIEGPFNDFLKLLEPHFMGKGPDIAEENLQSRIRGIILMALSNKLDYIVLSTGNKSELGMGYCTLYGDMAGGLGVISDVLKMQVYQLARWINREKEIIPQSVIDREPTAELRFGQKDTDTLPEYAVVDAVLKSYVEDYLSPEEISKKHHIPMEQVTDLIHRLHRAEYKRRQAAPGIRVSRKSYRTGRRYPIVEGWT